MQSVSVTEKGKAMTKEETSEVKTIDPAIASDVDGDGMLDFDPAKVQTTMVELVTLDHNLRAEGSSLADLLRHIAWTVKGIREA
jgi:hypothetical protein